MSKVIIIAEAGVNHNGNLNLAYELIDKAVEAGVDFIKFQTFTADSIVSKSAKKAPYQIENTSSEDESQYHMLKNLELSSNDHEKLLDYCNKKGIKFFSTAFDTSSLTYLKKLGFNLVKIPSGEITNLPYLRKAAELFPNVIISTGMATINDIRAAFQVFLDAGTPKNNITILHCNTEYPTPYEDVNLNAMLHIQKEFGVDIGYSDHTLGIEVPIAAVALGAKVIEKHFTLDRNMDGPDHKASLEPDELKNMVQGIRNIEKAILGSGIKEPSLSERKNKEIARKSIVAAQPIKKGDVFTEDNLTVKRPGTGISPMEWDKVIGLTAQKDFYTEDLISL